MGTSVNGSNISYSWNGPNGFQSNDQFPSVIESATLNNAGVYSLVVSVNGCESEAALTIVNILEKPDRPILVNNGPLCAGEDAIFTTNNESATTYNWIAPNLQEFTTNINEFSINNAQPSSSGNWQVYVTQAGCDSDLSSPNNLQVNPIPNAIASAERTAVCESNTIKLQGSPQIDGATYIWRGPNNYTSSFQNPIIENAGNSQAGVYELTVTTIAGCTGSSSVNIEIEEGVTITAISNNGPACLNGPTDIELKATVFPKDDGSYQYLWEGPNNFSSPDSVAIIPSATAQNNGNYILQVINAGGCISNSVRTIVNVTDPPATPEIPALSLGTPTPLCVGEEMILEADSYNGTVVTYHWDTPNGLLVTESANLTIENLSLEDGGTYTVFVTVDGCASRASRQFSLEVNTIPLLSATSNSPVCSGETLQFNADFLPGASYSWRGPNDFSSAIGPAPMITNTDKTRNSGTYTVEATVNGCTSEPIEVDVEIMQTPTVPIVDNSGPICISTLGNLLVLSVDSSSATPEARYSWVVNGEQFWYGNRGFKFWNN